VTWVLKNHSKIAPREQKLSVCHQSLSLAIQAMHGIENAADLMAVVGQHPPAYDSALAGRNMQSQQSQQGYQNQQQQQQQQQQQSLSQVEEDPMLSPSARRMSRKFATATIKPLPEVDLEKEWAAPQLGIIQEPLCEMSANEEVPSPSKFASFLEGKCGDRKEMQ